MSDPNTPGVEPRLYTPVAQSLLRLGSQRFGDFRASRLWLVLQVVLMALSPLFLVYPAHAAVPLLATVKEARGLTPAEAAKRVPIHLEGVVTYYDEEWGTCFVQDETGGIFVDLQGQHLGLQAGSLVAVDGVGAPGNYAPQVIEPKVTVFGTGTLPVPREVTFERLLTGKEDSQWIKIDSVVRSVERSGRRLSLNMSTMDGGTFSAVIPAETNEPVPPFLVGSKVTLRGACGTVFNQRRQLMGFRLFVPALSFVQVNERGESDLGAIPLQPIKSLLQFRPDEKNSQRVRVRGFVTLQREGHFLYLQDATGAVLVQSRQEGRLKTGDELEVVGFPGIGGYSPRLEEALWQRRGPGQAPEPRLLKPLFKSGAGFASVMSELGDYDGKLVRAVGVLVDLVTEGDGQTLLLRSNGQAFRALLKGRLAGRPMKAGSLLELTGVCVVETADEHTPRNFHLLLGDSEAVRVLQGPPWWTWKESLILMGAMGLLILLALGWGVTLRRRVAEQTGVIGRHHKQQLLLEKRYRELFENASDVIYTQDLHGVLLTANNAWSGCTGRSLNESVGLNLARFLMPGQEQNLATIVKRIESGEAPVQYQLVAQSKDGRPVLWEINSRPIYEEGVLMGIQSIARDVTERRKVEERWRDSQALYHSLVENLPVGVYRKSLAGRFTFANQRLGQLLGKRIEQLIGSRDADLFPPDLAARHAADDQRMAAGETLECVERLGGETEGPATYFQVIKCPVRNAKGAVVGTQGILLDISERVEAQESLERAHQELEGRVAERTSELTAANASLKQEISDRRKAEEALVRERNLLKALMDHVPDKIYFKDCSSQFTRVNPAMAALLGLAETEEAMGRTDFDFFSEEHARQALADEQSVISGGEALIGKEEQVSMADGRVFWFSTTKVPLRNDSGAVVGTFGVSRDITPSKLAELALKRQRAEYQMIFDSVPAFVVYKDKNNRHLRVNRYAAELLGRPAEEIEGKSAEEIGPVEQARKYYADDLEVIESGRAKRGIIEPLTTANGETRWLETDKIPYLDLSGAVVGVILFAVDVTERQRAREILQKTNEALEVRVRERTSELSRANEALHIEVAERRRAEEKLQRFAAQLEQNNGELQDFAYVASHDLQEPLRKVRAFGDRLRAKCGATLGEEGVDYLSRMQNAARRMQILIDDLLAYSRVTTKAQPFVEVDLNQVVREVLSDLEVRIEQVQGVVELEDLPSLEADPTQMRQLLQNLIGNGLKFHRDGFPPHLRVRGALLRNGNQLANGDGGRNGHGADGHYQLCVEDNGIGFDEKYLDRIFTVFQRLHGRGEYEGTGVGLAICRKIAVRHGGQITAKSTPGRGTTFIVTLPLKQPQDAPLSHEPDTQTY